MKKRLICGITAAAMAFNMAASMPLNVFAAGGDTKIYKKDGYTITYKIGNKWDKHQNIHVQVSNTGDESILNWALKYDACGEIDGIWNAGIYSSDEEYIVVKNSGYAAKVAAKRRRGEWLDTWGMIVDPNKTEEGFAFTLVGCPIAEYAKNTATWILCRICALSIMPMQNSCTPS